jgi:hypothetical protein
VLALDMAATQWGMPVGGARRLLNYAARRPTQIEKKNKARNGRAVSKSV